MRIKQITLMISCFLFLFIFSGCGQQKEIENTNTDKSNQKTGVSVDKPNTSATQGNQAATPKTTSGSVTANKTSKYLTFSNSIFGVSYSYPDNWDKGQLGSAILHHVTPSTGGAGISISCIDFKKMSGYEKATPKEIAQINNIKEIMKNAVEPGFKKTYSSYQRLSSQAISLNGLAGEKIYFQGTMNNVELKGVTTAVVKNGVTCFVIYVAQKDTYYDLHKSIGERSLSSLTLK